MRERWPARVALGAAGAAVLVLFTGAALRSPALAAVGLVGPALTAAGIWWSLTRRGARRVLARALAVSAPLWVLWEYASARLGWAAAVSALLWLAAAGAGRTALVRHDAPVPPPEHPAPEIHHPFVIMNLRAGGGKVRKLSLRERAEALGAEVLLLEWRGRTDVAELARKAASEGADLLGVAGGDGMQAPVADVAAALHLPFLVIPVGTRNLFARSLGLDCDDPVRALDALYDGVELHVDMGRVGDRPFVSGVAFGAYASAAHGPRHRETRSTRARTSFRRPAGTVRTHLEALPDLLAGHLGVPLTARAGTVTCRGPQALLVSNNPYGSGDVAGLGLRPRLDGGALGCVGVEVTGAAHAAGLLRGWRSAGLTRTTATDVRVDADAEWLPADVDGEAARLRTPVTCEVRPLALRVLVPRRRPGPRAARPPLDWRLLTKLARTPARPPDGVTALKPTRSAAP
ncbi:diacylglycerol/lipid kinase family protein [Streptomyces sp. CRN 30]|uniref:diacylglycerol/lipid kinase family protein n=1 Tax=Streptomyces sp. CRN 30 TaxID=3075613 RepID=UPI002A7FEAE2|nr:diacylglycerol kinase family protein [Streptomyces sp. CRN 30]